jgi:RNA polymerase sigma-70 factor, ECF subfamily
MPGTAGAETFERVVDRQAERLVRSLTAMFLDREMAADAAQDAFVQLYLHWDKVTASGEPDAWLYRVAINRCRDYRRKLARGRRLLERLAGSNRSEAASSEWQPRAEFLSIIAGLPRQQRVAAGLYYDADFSVAEIAAVMACSAKSVEARLYRARQALRQRLAHLL